MYNVKRLYTIVLAIILFLLPINSNALQVHRVRPGESLFTISRSYNVSVNDVLNQNKYLVNPNTIFPSQVLILPATVASNIYTVREGDTLFKIANLHGITIMDILSRNNINNPDMLRVGQQLFIPERKKPQMPSPKPVEKTYTVSRGDTLYLISKRQGIPLDELIRMNNITNPNHVFVGQVLKLPPTASTAGRQPESSFQHTIAQLIRMYPETFYLKATGNERKIALTFDDGPNPSYTSQVLDVLQKYNVKATFFIMGSRGVNHSSIVERIVREGHIIANHTWSHPDLRKVSSDQLKDEIIRTENAIQSITGLRTALIRPPYGGVNQATIEGLRDMNYRVINWSVDSVDWRDRDADKILTNTLPGITRNDIVLFHDASGEGVSMQSTVDALPELIETLLSHGYTFVTVDELLGISAYQ